MAQLTARRSSLTLWASLVILIGIAGASPARAEVELERGVSFLAARGPAEVRRGEPLELRFELCVPPALRQGQELFVHVEPAHSSEGRCRMVQDVDLARGADESPEGSGRLLVDVGWSEVPCPAGVYDIFVGVWNPETGRRLAVLGGRGHFDRARYGQIRVVDGEGEMRSEQRRLRPMAPPPPPAFTPPWTVVGLFLALLISAVLALVVQRLRPSWGRLERASPPHPRWLFAAAGALLPLVVLGWGIWTCLGFVKDDAYISFRYAHNLASGRGLVFNTGEQVEGYTNFLWTILMIPFDLLGADLVQVCDLLGPSFALILVLIVIRASKILDGEGPLMSHLWAATWLASSSSLALWSVGGLEQSLAALLPFAGALSTWRGFRESAPRWLVIGSGLLIGACLTRPEGHLFVLLIGVFWLLSRRWDRRFLIWSAPLAGALLLYHSFRFLYFGRLLPNTYLVKAVSGDAVFRAGFELAADLLSFNLVGLVFIAAALSLFVAPGPDRGLWRWGSVIVGLCFLLYVIKVGTDELIWHRLFLPALPFVVLAASTGLRFLATAAASILGEQRRWIPYAVGWCLVGVAVWNNLSFTTERMGGTGYASCTGANHPDLGKFLTRHGEAGDLVAFQDMGATPFHAPDLRFLDLVGLVDPRIASLYQRHGVHPFVGATRARGGSAFCLEFRDYVFERDPEWVVLVPWPDRDRVRAVADAFPHEDSERLLRRFGSYANTQFDCHLYEDPRFRERYVHVRTWMRSPVYYLSTFLRRDRWQRDPLGVVLDAPPAHRRGPRASFANDVELLGGVVEEEVVVERHEVFVTTWWRLPGRRSDDLQVFVHIESSTNPRMRVSHDHPPGDWMYPASRWSPGQVIEDRVLVQLPPSLQPGEYEVYVGLFDRRTGRRIELRSGSRSEEARILLGELRIRSFRHFLDPLIPRTRPAAQRRSCSGSRR